MGELGVRGRALGVMRGVWERGGEMEWGGFFEVWVKEVRD